MESKNPENTLVLPSCSSSTPPSSPLPEKTILEENHKSSHSPSSPPLFAPYFPEDLPSFSSSVSVGDYFKPPTIGAGLYNLGNTCFLNSILQCFTHTVPLLQSLCSSNHPYPCCRELEGFCVICTLIEHVRESLLSPERVVAPYRFFNNLSNISSLFQRYQQEDAHEFLQCLLDRLDSCCLDMNMQVSNSSSQEDSFVKTIFGGCLRSQLRCCNCGHCSNTFEPLIDLSLEIEDVDTLPDALKSFTKVEKIEDSETKFTCEKCKIEVLLEKRFTVDQAPSVATFHLKRFKSDSFYVEKIDKYVVYPLELDLQPYTSSSESFDARLKYELYALVVHIGLSNSSGHYICYIRSSPQMWYMMDDSKVTRVSEQDVLSQEAYILFYASQGTPWFSSFNMELQNQIKGLNMSTTSPTSVLDYLCPMRAPSSGESDNTINDVETREDKERFSTPFPFCNYNFEVVKDNADFVDDCPKTPPPRSPSPDMYSEEQPGVGYSIPRNHLKVKEQTSFKRPAVNNAADESKGKEAIRLTRSMPLSRAMRLKACLVSSPKTERSSRRKKHKPVRSFMQ